MRAACVERLAGLDERAILGPAALVDRSLLNMPEVHFDVRWPDGARRTYYSPSTAVRQHLRAGERYALPDFLARARAAMHAASERVRAKYGYACSSALDTLGQIEETARAFQASSPPGEVTIVAMNE
jgi:uncharacterized repeat protein (TIGR04042 family)